MGKVVCVTGGSGYIASWLVKLLLRRGYSVKATVRNLGDPSKVEHLKALEGADERLEIVEANLLEEGSFDGAVDACDGVFHTASPVILDHVTHPQVELVEPAVKGTLNVLGSCLKAKTVKRVVLTSSMASLLLKSLTTQTDDVLLDKTFFSDLQSSQDAKYWYALSKTLAEDAGKKFAEENGLDLVVLNPGLVIGPLLQPTLNTTSAHFLSLVTQGKSGAMTGGVFMYVDVRDVADAHVAAFEDPSANGNYSLVAEVLFCSQALKILQRLYPTHNFPKSPEENRTAIPPVQVSDDKAKSLGVNFISVEQSMKDTLESLKEKNLFSFTKIMFV